MTPEIPIEKFSVFAASLDHPECLAFDRAGTLWAGGEAGQVYRIDGEGGVSTVTSLGSFNAGLAFSPSDELFVCNPALGIVRVAADGKYSVLASHVGNQKIVCANYGLFDAAGNYYVTDSGNWLKRNGRLLRISPAGRGEFLTGALGYANGLALSADENFLFLVESDTNSVFRLALHPDGSVSAPELYAPECGRFPDGLALDSVGNLYVSCYASDEIWRLSPAGEKTLFAWDRWAIRLGSPTNLAFGGKDFDELYVANLARTTITRAKIGRKGQPLANQKLSSMKRLGDKVAIVTGASHGIGRAIAERFAEEGAAVFLCARDAGAGEAAAAEFRRAGGEATFLNCDVSRPDQVAGAVQAAAARNGRIDILCNNAAYLAGTWHSSGDAPDDEWEQCFRVSLMGTQWFTRDVLKYMIQQQAGSIINLGSVQSLVGGRNSAAYTAIKTALVGLTRSVAYDYGPHHIRCNIICAGAIKTRISPAPGSELHQRQLGKTFLGRIGEPREVAHAALFLASDESSYITGAVLPVDGGWTAM